MNTTLENVIDSSLIVLTGTIGLQQLESIIGIISVSLSCVWILVKLVIKVYQAVKTKNFTNLENDINKAKEDLEKLKNDLEEKEKEKDAESNTE